MLKLKEKYRLYNNRILEIQERVKRKYLFVNVSLGIKDKVEAFLHGNKKK